jgi:Helix-turn-helix domain
MKEIPELLSTEQAAEKIGVAPQTLTKWRMTRYNLAFVKIGRKVYYRPDDLLDFLESHVVRNETEQ